MVFNATFNNISVISVEETGGPGKNDDPVRQNSIRLSVVSQIKEKIANIKNN